MPYAGSGRWDGGLPQQPVMGGYGNVQVGGLSVAESMPRMSGALEQAKPVPIMSDGDRIARKTLNTDFYKVTHLAFSEESCSNLTWLWRSACTVCCDDTRCRRHLWWSVPHGSTRN